MFGRKTLMNYWERLTCSAAKDASVDLKDINTIEVHYDCGEDAKPPHIIRGSDKASQFLSEHSSFTSVQESLKLPGTIDHISCVNVICQSANCTDRRFFSIRWGVARMCSKRHQG